jgi:hypothetical protein
MECVTTMPELARTREWHGVDRAVFQNEIVPLRRPAVLRGFASDWPAVQAGLQSAEALCDYLRRSDSGRPALTFLGPPQIEGRFWYREDMRGLNYEQRMISATQLLNGLLAARRDSQPPSIYAGALPVAEHFPGFARDNATDLPGDHATARLWIGNRATVSTHFDMSHNLAVVIGGHRRFTFFPPEQVANLYVGPFDFTLAGPPVSMVDLKAPDFDRYPRFAEALATAETADLQPGDAVFVPYMWWHHVEALDPVNVLLNYWWNLTDRSWQGSPFKALIHAIMTIRDLPENERGIWRAWFDRYAFGDGHDAVAHLPEHGRGALGDINPQVAQAIKNYLIEELKR